MAGGVALSLYPTVCEWDLHWAAQGWTTPWSRQAARKGQEKNEKKLSFKEFIQNFATGKS